MGTGLRAGKMRKLVTIQRLTGARDTTGNETATYTTFATVWAWIEPYIGSARAGREEFSGGQIQGLDYTRFHIRYLAGISPKAVVVYNGPSYDIQAVNNRDERNFEVELLAKERQ